GAPAPVAGGGGIGEIAPPGGYGRKQGGAYRAIGEDVAEMVNMPCQQRAPYDTAGYLEDLDYTEQVIRRIGSEVSSSKIEVECPVVGYDWGDGIGQPINSEQFQALIKKTNATPERDVEYSGELTFNFSANHEVWFPDAKSFESVADIALTYQTYGISIWYFGGEGPEFWEAFKNKNTAPESAKGAASPNRVLLTGPVKPPKARGIEIFTDKTRGHYDFFQVDDLTDTSADNFPKVIQSERQGRHWLDVRFGYGIAEIKLSRVENF